MKYGAGKKILIMAGGTGGHVFPALSIAEKLQDSGAVVEWLGATGGFEIGIIGKTEIPLHLIKVTGLRGKGIVRLIMAPFMIIRAIVQAIGILNNVRPNCVLGMGGFVTGPGGIAAWITGRRLLIHEQNAVPGMSNKILAPFAFQIMQAFPATFAQGSKLETTGNPVRSDIVAIQKKPLNDDLPLNILVLGGSQGAVAINELIPQVISNWGSQQTPNIIHQAGKRNLNATLSAYQSVGLGPEKQLEEQPGEQLVITGFLDDMAKAFTWADIVICRSGASTVCELAVAGLASILIPYPHHKDRQQSKNAQWLSNAGAAILIEQSDLACERLLKELKNLSDNRARLAEMSTAAAQLGMPTASNKIAEICLEAANG
jgi:UDP-N-acetylglucosamine--N-acetylmuramyl-(pentapeptide) pyrophosphoryl-undecaprenol N-acetylglucosamine transferase